MNLDFGKYADGLVPAIVQDNDTMRVLMLGFMNAEALTQSMATGKVTFYSRSRKTLWTKGEQSGNFLDLVSISMDCDQDTLLVLARPNGPVCHTGADTCFGDGNSIRHSGIDFLGVLAEIIEERRGMPKPDSYVSSLFESGLNKIAQKVGEEAVETIIAAKDGDADAFLNEAADLVFHLLVLFNAKGVSLNDVSEQLRRRHR